MDLKHSKFKKEDIVFLVSFISILFVQIYKAKLGMGSRDEHFYITLGYRFYQGDALFYDDTHIAQMIGFFITPLVYLFRLIKGSNEGIVLGFRYFYVLFTLLIGLCIYLKFRKEYHYYALLAASAYMLFTPFQIMALSYNTMSVGFLLLALLCYKKQNLFRLFLSGIFYGCAVINTPYLALGYVFILFLVIKHRERFDLKELLSLSCGIALTAISFLVFVFTRASLSEVLGSLQYLVDPSHSTSIPKLFMTNGYRLIRQLHITFFLLVFELVYAIWFREQVQEKKVLEVSYLINIFSLIYLGLIHTVDASVGGYVGILVPIYIMGLVLLITEKRNSYLTFCYGVSTFHAFLLSISSNVGPRSFLGSLIVACVITILLLKDEEKKVLPLGMTSIFIALLLFFKMTNVYGGSNDYSVQITQGPLKGLYDTQEAVENYNQTLEDIQYIDTLDGEYMNCISYQTWTYLASNKKCGTNSTYIYFWYKDQYENAYDTYALNHSDKNAWIYFDEKDTPFALDENDTWMKQFTKIKELNRGILYQK